MRRDITLLASTEKSVGYSDSNNTIQSELKKLYDNDLDTYLEYTKPGSYIQVSDATAHLMNSVMINAKDTNIYFGLSIDDKTYRWFGIDNTTDKLKEYTTQNNAITNSIHIDGECLFDLHKGIVCRYMRTYMVSDINRVVELSFIRGKNTTKINKLEQRISILEAELKELTKLVFKIDTETIKEKV